ncbi:MAG: peptidylprolyl isomerase [Elusimicrobiota bacterium]
MRNLSNLILAAVLLLAAGPARAKVLEDVVARVNGVPLMLTEYRKNLRGMIDNVRINLPEILKDEDKIKEIREKILEQMIDDELMAQEAEKTKLSVHTRELEKGVQEVMDKGFTMDPATGRRLTEKEKKEALAEAIKAEGLSESRFRERISRQLKIRKLIEMKVNSEMKEPGDEVTQKAFAVIKEIANGSTDVVKGMSQEKAQAYVMFGVRVKNAHMERVRVSHILVKLPPGASLVAKNEALTKAKALKKTIDGGGDFFELATNESDDQESAPRGGDLGPILRGWMPPPFEQAAFALAVGDVSEPVETDFGFHLIRVQEKRASEPLNFDKLQSDIKQFIMSIDHQEALLAFVESLRKKATIEKTLPAE